MLYHRYTPRAAELEQNDAPDDIEPVGSRCELKHLKLMALSFAQAGALGRTFRTFPARRKPSWMRSQLGEYCIENFESPFIV